MYWACRIQQKKKPDQYKLVNTQIYPLKDSQDGNQNGEEKAELFHP